MALNRGIMTESKFSERVNRLCKRIAYAKDSREVRTFSLSTHGAVVSGSKVVERITADQIGHIATMATYLLSKSEILEIDSVQELEVIFVAVATLVAVCTSEVDTGLKYKSIAAARECWSRAHGMKVENVISEVFKVPKLNYGLMKLYGREMKEADMLRVHRVMKMLNAHFVEMFGCSIAYLLEEQHRKDEFSEFMEIVMPVLIGEVNRADIQETEVALSYIDWMESYLGAGNHVRHAKWEADLKRDYKLQKITWKYRLETMMEAEKLEGAKEQVGLLKQRKEVDQADDSIFLCMQERHCFKEQDGMLSWDAGDVERTTGNIEWMLRENKPFEWSEHRESMRSARSALMAIERALGSMVADDHDDQRCVVIPDLRAREVGDLAKALQRLLVGNVLTVDGKHIAEQTSRDIVLLMDKFVPNVLERKIQFQMEESIGASVDAELVHVEKYGLWRIELELEERAEEEKTPVVENLMDCLATIYERVQREEFVRIVKSEWDRSSYKIVKHGICDESGRLEAGKVKAEEVVDRLIMLVSRCGFLHGFH